MTFDGRVAIVTGAARGLGRDYAAQFASEGAAVGVADVADVCEAVEAIRADGGRAVGISVDVTDEASTLAMAKQVADAFGRIDILVNNAAIWGDLERAPLTEMPADYWDVVMSVNVKGPFLCSRAVLPYMRELGAGRIINISSMGAYMLAGVYGVSKLAVNQLTYALAGEVGADAITVNAIAPGTIDNEATRRQVPEAAMERMVGAGLIKRAGTSRDLFAMIRYLASDEAEWVTGQTFLVNGGYNTRF